MSNTETMQLDLFEGKILTNDQRLEIQQYISKCDKEVVRKREENIKIQLLLDRAGFREGIDYINDFDVCKKLMIMSLVIVTTILNGLLKLR